MAHSNLIINGKQVDWPSVTGVVGLLRKEFLERWRGKIGNEAADKISRESAALGSEVHDMIEEFLKNGYLEHSREELRTGALFKAWHEWWDSQAFEPVKQEIKVISKKKKFHGTFDSVLSVPGVEGKILADWKISKSDDHFRYLQLAGYAYAYKEMFGEKINEGLIVRVHPETAKVKVTEINNLWDYVPLFLALRKLYDFVRNGKVTHKKNDTNGNKTSK